MISNRIQKVAKMVTKGHKVADIGCDHGYTSIYLIQNQISHYIIAMDINEGPLERAKANVINYNCQNHIELRLSNGLSKLKDNEVDTILISGMGGNLIIDILDKNKEQFYKVKELILQPQSDIYRVRNYIQDNNFLIVDEDMLIEEDKYYNIIKAYNVSLYNIEETQFKLANQEEFYYGRLLLNKRNLVLYSFLVGELNKRNKILKNISHITTDNIKIRVKEVEEEINIIKKSLKYYEKER